MQRLPPLSKYIKINANNLIWNFWMHGNSRTYLANNRDSWQAISRTWDLPREDDCNVLFNLLKQIDADDLQSMHWLEEKKDCQQVWRWNPWLLPQVFHYRHNEIYNLSSYGWFATHVLTSCMYACEIIFPRKGLLNSFGLLCVIDCSGDRNICT